MPEDGTLPPPDKRPPRSHVIARLMRLRAMPLVRRAVDGAIVSAFTFAIIFGLGETGQETGVLLLMASFGPSCVLVFALPQSPLAQPRNVIGGHLLSAAAGLAALSLFGASPLSMALGVALSIFVMAITATLHPPGAANPAIIISGGQGLAFLVTPVLTGAILITLTAVFYHRVVSRKAYPVKNRS